ncbi:ArnT family glycosyltransferase [Plantactinospora solaniradicis]|uniref:ArnT family glycosyltransferase n=1 Tax=Plantactinospora solaniradicis TaxID=1723736 RepID=A0ABW1KCW5_9ACTN
MSPTTVTLSAPASVSAPSAGRRTERLGWSAVGGITAVVASTWVPLLGAPFGDNHLGRIVGRYALHERNLQEQGILGSQFGADWAPYASSPYAHHPPLLNLLTALTGLLPGDAEYRVWLPPYLLALLIIPAGAALLRGFGIRWSATLLAVGLMVATPFYWVYSPLMFDLGPILALSAAVVRLRARPDPGRALVAGTCAAALLTTLVSWPGIAFAAALGLWLFLARRIDRTTILVAAGMLTGLAISLAFVVGVTGAGLLGGQAELRSTGGDYTVPQFLGRQWHFAYLLLPVWYLGALPLGATAGLLDRRTRGYLAMAIGFTAAWVLGLSNGAYVHSYWSYPVLVVGLVGMGVLLDRIVERLVDGPVEPTPAPATAPPTALATATALAPGPEAARRGSRPLSRIVGRRSAGLVTVVLIWAALGTYLGAGLVAGSVRHRLLTEPTQAGRLVAEHPPAAGQRYAWVAGTSVTTPRWFAYYWRLAPRMLTAETLRTDPTARPDDLVLMNLRQRPDWLPASIEARAVARDGPYALFPVATLRAAVRD